MEQDARIKDLNAWLLYMERRVNAALEYEQPVKVETVLRNIKDDLQVLKEKWTSVKQTL